MSIQLNSQLKGFSAVMIGSLLLLCGCSVTDVEQRTDLAKILPSSYRPDQSDQQISSPSTVRLQWQDSFPSRQLQEDIRLLEANNYTLAAARIREARAALEHKQTTSAMDPTGPTVSTEYLQKKEQKDGQTVYTDMFSIRAGFEWEVDIWDRLEAKKQAALLRYEEQQALTRKARLELQSMLVANWIRYHAASRQEQLVHKQQQNNQQVLALLKLRQEYGEGNNLDILQQSQRIVSLKRNIKAIHETKASVARAYAILLGQTSLKGYLPPDDLPDVRPITSLPQPKQLLSDRPDLQAAFSALQAADQEVAAAIADRLPRLAFGFSYELSGSNPASLGNDTALSFLANILTPIFNAGRKKMMVKQRRTEAEEALAILQQTMLDAFLQVENTFATENRLFSELTLINEELTIAVETGNEAKLRYTHGEESFLSFLFAEISLQQLQQEKVLLEQKLLLKRLELLAALGTEWAI
jgi:outer membrane protein TolC